ncbi:cereblon family protein [Desulfosudis oleivorans]|uniref:CULT domain-containing protein n=1 Tax=Desulfosudis oleivorans (strain DSM 6200 / JCM 39069 / Hxd3) TaxID=96561 RepID=A8ZUM1_DESOH|nr:cereblon family protein [Desulfosudis oleivorans]ABW66434.1 hypothetical protein Dole_0624 [Desulfosudis oleivorans Hxd3]
MQRHDHHTTAFTEHSRFPAIIGRVPLRCLKTEIENNLLTPPSAATRTGSEDEKAPEKQEALRCFRCLHPITRREEQTTVNGRHSHVFANPGGMIFEIGCFRGAPGCGHAGSPTLEFTWFDGYAWQVAVCSGCMSHLGWYYTTAGASFYGLILNRLIDAP